MEEVKVNITTDKEVTTLLIGKANTPAEKEIFEAVNFKGLIAAPADFLLDKVDAKLIKKENVLIMVDETEETIILHSDYGNKLKHIVQGKLVKNPDLAPLKINTNETFTLKDMIKVLRFRRKLFNSEEEFKAIINTLMTFNAKINVELKLENDNRGNITEELVMKAKTNMKLHFTLNAAAFKGGPVAKFKVDIYFDVISNTEFKFYFESLDYQDLQSGQAFDLITEQVKRLKGYTIIHK